MSSTDLTKALQEHQASIDAIKNELRSQGLEEVNGEWVDATKVDILKRIDEMQSFNLIASRYKPEFILNLDFNSLSEADIKFIKEFTLMYEPRFKLPF